MKKIVRCILVAATLSTAGVSPGWAGIIVDHQPHPYGGPSSDTSFWDAFGNPYWQRLADDFTLASADQAVSLSFWAFYDADNPPPTETVRIRFYDSRPSDTLPGLVIYEETFLNPSRVATGGFIGIGIVPHEYRFEASLTSPVAFDAGVKYWLEVVQIGDISTKFRWEDSVSNFNGIAFTNPGVGDWRSTLPGGPADTAFQLISPEPAFSVMLAPGLVFITRRQRSGKGAA
jgi:hypothetical protein